MANRITFLCIDAIDPEALARFWAAALGWEQIVPEEAEDEGLVRIRPDAEAAICIDFLQVPDGPKVGKNRLHLDVNATDRDQAAELERLLELGARPVDIGQGDPTWHVLADPEGNEFCLLRRQVDPL